MVKRVTLATVIRKPIVSRWDHDFDYTFSAKSSKGSCTQLVLNWALGSSTTWKRNSTTSLEPYTCCQLNILIPFSFDLLSTLEMGRLTFKFTKPISRILLTGYTKSLLDPSLSNKKHSRQKEKGKETMVLPVNKDSINSGHYSTNGEQEIPPVFSFSIEHAWSCIIRQQ